tara:strand:- start:489 stop:878 length:390 start_codon:yes stop_codon:yes gene_type:complete
MRVEVYWNLHKKCWSVRHKGKVIDHKEVVDLMDVTWVVQPAGNARVRREKRKNVHAFARGTLADNSFLAFPGDMSDHNRASYNPYENTTFMRGFIGNALTKSNYARFRTLTNYTDETKKPRAYAIGAAK